MHQCKIKSLLSNSFVSLRNVRNAVRFGSKYQRHNDLLMEFYDPIRIMDTVTDIAR
jgi:hypothetical protein